MIATTPHSGCLFRTNANGNASTNTKTNIEEKTTKIPMKYKYKYRSGWGWNRARIRFENPSSLVQKLSKKIGNKEIILVTGHRRENHGEGFERICKALKTIALDDTNRLVIYPVHLNPKVQEPVNRVLLGIKNILLIDPLAYQDFIWLLKG